MDSVIQMLDCDRTVLLLNEKEFRPIFVTSLTVKTKNAIEYVLHAHKCFKKWQTKLCYLHQYLKEVRLVVRWSIGTFSFHELQWQVLYHDWFVFHEALQNELLNLKTCKTLFGMIENVDLVKNEVFENKKIEVWQT